MAQMTFGTVLREARERKGYDLTTAARRLRIRPDILRAIEENDFSRMPPRGYTRNMVNAYARLLGLNPTEITRMYLDEAYAYQVGRARDEAEPTRFDIDSPARSRRTRDRSQPQEERTPRQNAFGRTLYDDRPSYARGGSGGGRRNPEERTHPSRHTVLPNSQYTNFYAGPSAPSAVRSRLPYIVAGVIILILLIVILVLAFGNTDGTSEDDVPSVPITGLTDTTQDNGEEGEGDQQQQAAPLEAAPTKAVLTYEVASGASPWIELYKDGAENPYFGQAVSGPATESIDVTGTLRIDTPQPDVVKVLVDDEPVELSDTDGDSVYSYTVDFPAILEQWNQEHPGTASSQETPTTD